MKQQLYDKDILFMIASNKLEAWNSDEKSWDCPCHGSRFTYSGKVINGPANEDLAAFSEV